MHPAAGQLDRKTWRGDADRHFIQSHAMVARTGKPQVAGEQEERAHRIGMPLHHTKGRMRKRHQAHSELCPAPHHVEACLRVIRSEYFQVKPGGKNTRSRGLQHDNGRILFGPVQRFADLGQHGGGQDVHLAIIHRDRRNSVLIGVCNPA